MVVVVVCGYKGGAGEGSGEALESCCSCVGHMRRFIAATNASWNGGNADAEAELVSGGLC